MEEKTQTLKDDRHFLLVDDKIGLEEDAENDPCDLHGDKKRATCVESDRTAGLHIGHKFRSDNSGHVVRDPHNQDHPG